MTPFRTDHVHPQPTSGLKNINAMSPVLFCFVLSSRRVRFEILTTLKFC